MQLYWFPIDSFSYLVCIGADFYCAYPHHHPPSLLYHWFFLLGPPGLSADPQWLLRAFTFFQLNSLPDFWRSLTKDRKWMKRWMICFFSCRLSFFLSNLRSTFSCRTLGEGCVRSSAKKVSLCKTYGKVSRYKKRYLISSWLFVTVYRQRHSIK